jgi:hypothetical protein
MPEPVDWTVRAADTIDGVVGTVRDRAVQPLTTLGRAVVFGLLAAIVATVTTVVLAAGVVRLGVVYLPFHPVARRVWVTEAGLGGIFVLLGLLAWSRRSKRTAT